MHNLARGITYKYLTRGDNEMAQSNIDEVLHKFASHAELVHIFSINELFDMLPICSILVIEHDETDRLRVFVELPVLENNMRLWWVEADHIVARQWHRKILQVLKNREPAENPYKKMPSDVAQRWHKRDSCVITLIAPWSCRPLALVVSATHASPRETQNQIWPCPFGLS
jgi:hypothetical protein